MPNGMEEANCIFKTISGIPNDNQIELLLTLYQEIFEGADAAFFIKRLKNKSDVFSILAFHSNKLIGFKIGYSQSENIFYSWIGGIKKTFRNQGIGKQLAMIQENHARLSGFKILKTKSMNRFKPMMILNLKNGFNITKIYTNTKGQTKIVFEKSLNKL